MAPEARFGNNLGGNSGRVTMNNHGSSSPAKGELPKDVDAYIANAAPEARPMLMEMRRIIREAAPAATESISYQIPAWRYHGALVYIGAAKKHCALHAISKEIFTTFAEELKSYGTSRGAVRFLLGTPLPERLIASIVRMRVAENEARAAEKSANKR